MTGGTLLGDPFRVLDRADGASAARIRNPNCTPTQSATEPDAGETGWPTAGIERTKRPSGQWVDWKPNSPTRVWQMDMTKIYIDGVGWLHHIATIDLFDGAIVGHRASPRARAEEWEMAWDDALLNRFSDGPRGSDLVLQVDNGCQPTPLSFREHIAVSGTRPGIAFLGGQVSSPKPR